MKNHFTLFSKLRRFLIVVKDKSKQARIYFTLLVLRKNSCFLVVTSKEHFKKFILSKKIKRWEATPTLWYHFRFSSNLFKKPPAYMITESFYKYHYLFNVKKERIRTTFYHYQNFHLIRLLFQVIKRYLYKSTVIQFMKHVLMAFIHNCFFNYRYPAFL